jgi:hypothetical protein
MGGVCSTYEEEEWWIQVLVGKTEAKIPLGRSRLRLEMNL